MRTSFSDIRVRLEEAESKIEALQSQLYHHRKLPVSIDFNQNPDGSFGYYIKSNPVPVRLSILVGEISYQLRTCLDHVASKIYSEITGDRYRGYFPIDESVSSLLSNPKHAAIFEAWPTLKIILSEKIKPTKSDSPSIYYLNKIRNSDSHVENIIVHEVTSVLIPKVTDKNGNEMNDCLFFVGGGGQLKMASFGSEVTLSGDPVVEVEYKISEQFTDLAGLDLIRTLKGMSLSVRAALNIIEFMYLKGE